MTMNLNEHQRYVEKTYSKKNVKAKIISELLYDEDIRPLLAKSADLIHDFLSQKYYDSKNARLEELAFSRDIDHLVNEIAAVTLLHTKPILFTSVVGEITGALGMTNKIEGTKTAAELLAVMADADLYDIYKEDLYAPLMLVSNFVLSDELLTYIEKTKYLPPMVVSPLPVTKNFSYSYLTEQSSMILGKGNHHDGDICLDSINKLNQIPLSLNERLLTTLSETPKGEFNDEDQRKQWHNFVTQSYAVYRDLIQLGNTFWLTHKVDKRGRTYAQGYHVSTQGNQFRKAIIEFADKEVISL